MAGFVDDALLTVKAMADGESKRRPAKTGVNLNMIYMRRFVLIGGRGVVV